MNLIASGQLAQGLLVTDLCSAPTKTKKKKKKKKRGTGKNKIRTLKAL